ncbi:hypothetical protein F0L74_05915 [Chitinophaga agrisoli]|uniref:Uncharacterized protein n=1 Tax=Chitinophaga agrisoli TaxID=2607653 RepID=A0A5B2W478_9BACT|nr:hypothetical protein [Chitinophaga agrisoli]KAA2245492.1 hypothetical protein F0L74_05915 [Chitinophaga agrisoli]
MEGEKTTFSLMPGNQGGQADNAPTIPAITRPVMTGQVSEEQISAWKKQYGQVFGYDVDNKICYLRSVDRDTYALALAKVTSSNPSLFSKTILESIWLGGDEEIRKNDRYYLALVDFVEDLMAKKKGTLREL